MSSKPPEPQGDDEPRADDTAAFSRFYLGQPDPGQPQTGKNLLYRVFVGWWKDR